MLWSFKKNVESMNGGKRAHFNANFPHFIREYWLNEQSSFALNFNKIQCFISLRKLMQLEDLVWFCQGDGIHPCHSTEVPTKETCGEDKRDFQQIHAQLLPSRYRNSKTFFTSTNGKDIDLLFSRVSLPLLKKIWGDSRTRVMVLTWSSFWYE